MTLSIEQAIHLGLQAHQAGDKVRAEQIYREVLTVDPKNANAWHLWGALAFENSEFTAAVERMGRAVELLPSEAQFHGNLGLALTHTGHFSEAEQALRSALQLVPHDADIWFKLGNVYLAKKEYPQAEASFRQAIKLAPDMGFAYSNLGAMLVDQQLFSDAIAVIHAGLAHSPQLPELHCNLALAYERQDHLEQAERCYQRCLQLRPTSIDYLLGLANVYVRQKRHDESLKICEHALKLAPQVGKSWRAYGVVLASLRRTEEAEAAFRESIRLDPENPESHVNHCITLHDLGMLDAAIKAGQRAIELEPKSANAYDNIGAACSRKGDFDGALHYLGKAIELDPQHAMAHFHLGLTQLLLGQFEDGWREYEWRFQHPQSVRREIAAPRWRGEPLSGRSILLQAEQGFGDTLHFIRYAKLLRDQGAHVILECSPALIPFIQHCQVVDDLVANNAPLPCPDFHCPLLSLGEVLKITPRSPALPVPYLHAESDLIAKARPRLAKIPGLKIGIAWQGDPKHTWDRFRSLPLREFAPLAEIPNVSLVSVQRGTGEEQLATAPFPVHAFDPPLDHYEYSFRDTAAVLLGLDLVISADTAVAHLAGGLGVPIWLLVNASPDWRWGMTGDSTPWYPTMRLFRQTTLGDWNDVFARMATAIATLQR